MKHAIKLFAGLIFLLPILPASGQISPPRRTLYTMVSGVPTPVLSTGAAVAGVAPSPILATCTLASGSPGECNFASGGANFPATPGFVYNTSTSASRNATSQDAVTLLNTSPTTTLSPVLLPAATSSAQGAVILPAGAVGNTLGGLSNNFHPNARIFCYGTSFFVGTGALDAPGSTPSARSVCSNAGRDTPGVPYNGAIYGSIAATDAIAMLSGATSNNPYYPDAIYPTLVLVETFENDSASIDATFTKNMVMYQETWPAEGMPYGIPASSSTNTGSFAGVTFPVQPSFLAASQGSGKLWVNGTGSATFTIPAGNTGTKMHFTYPCYATGGGTFTLTNTTTSTNYVDNVSGTTTFTSTCSGSVGTVNLTPQTQEFTIAAGANTIVFAPTAGNTGNVQVYRVAYLPPAYNATTGTLGYANQGVVQFSTLGNNGFYSTAASVVNPIIVSVSSQLKAEGLPVFIVDQNAIETGGGLTARAFNATLDTSTTGSVSCALATAANHPSECWSELWWTHFRINQINNGYLVSYPNLGGKGPAYTGQTNTVISLPNEWGPSYFDKSESFAGNGSIFRKVGNNRFGIRSGTDATAGPNNGRQTTVAYGSTGQTNSLCAGVWTGTPTALDADANFSSKACLSVDGLIWGSYLVMTPETVAFSATPTFSAVTSISQLTLTGNVTSSTLAAGSNGAQKTFQICQDATGSRTFVWPTTVKGGMTIGSTASTCSIQTFTNSTVSGYAFWYASSPGVINQ